MACYKVRDERGVGKRLRRPMRAQVHAVQVASACWAMMWPSPVEAQLVAGGTEGNLAAQILVHPVTVAVERAGGDYDGMVCLGADHLAIVVDRPHDDCAARLVLDDVSDLGGCHLFHVVIGFHMVVYERDDAALHGLVAWEGGGAPYGPGRPAGQVVVIAGPAVTVTSCIQVNVSRISCLRRSAKERRGLQRKDGCPSGCSSSAG